MALLYQKSKPQTKKPPDWVTPEFSTYVGCIILYGTSTPPTKGGEIAHDGISTQNYHRTNCSRCHSSISR